MKYLGLDYGSKRVGVALSDDSGTMAFPKGVVPNNRYLMSELQNMVKSNKVEKIIVGESKNFDMNDNPIFKDAKFFAEELARDTQLEVEFEPEYLTSHQAERTSHELGGSNFMLDASAAAIILQSYLDKNRSVN
jgi:putative holliday junction resolvase